MPEPNWKPKTIRLYGRDYKEFRESLFNRACGCCEDCGRYVPLYIDGEFDQYYCGHVSHIKSRGAGGEDTLDNAKWKCFDCHRREHDNPCPPKAYPKGAS